jgi:lipopolysaccharide biosynthesis glycosyltransferase
MNDNTIITLADSNYFDMLNELVDSIKKHPESEKTSICVLDAGLTEEQIKIIEEKVYKVKKANWDI